ncbi:MAG: FAD-dependent oxidoreductase [Actinobacteria bacterium]|nr:FAD-dependent oxidoreductase [Actinomycetota bacterium]
MVTLEPILKEKYEVVVVGSGIGGLCTAAILAREGLDVLVIEKSHQPGGMCTSFKIDDFTFDLAVSTLSGLGEIGFHTLRTLFDFLRQQVDVMPCVSPHRIHFGDITTDLHQDTDALTSELGALFPSQAGSIISLMRELEHIYLATLECSGPPLPREEESFSQRWQTFNKHPVSKLRCSQYKRISAKKILLKYLSDPVAIAFFDADLFYNTGYHLEELSSIQAALSIMDRQIGGAHYPIGSSQQIPDRLERSIIKHGGQVVFKTAVEEITIESGKATGVILSGGRKVKADAVVSDNSLVDLYCKLVKKENLKPATVAWSETLEPTRGVVTLYLGVTEDVVPAGTKPNTIVINEPKRDPGGFISVNIPSMYDHNLAPAGHHSLTIIAAANQMVWNSSSTPSYSSAQYEKLKEEESRIILERLKSSFPSLEEGIVEKHITSPLTIEHRLNRKNGALAGPRANNVLLPSELPGNTTEIRGLFHVGDSTLFGRGVSNVAASSFNCSQCAMKYLGRNVPDIHDATESFIVETVPVKPEIFAEDVIDTVSAVLESNRCLRCTDSPCTVGCPAEVDITTFVRRLSSSDFIGAAKTIREAIPLGGICGRLCPGEVLCEATCRRREIDSPVKISQLGALACATVLEPEGKSSVSTTDKGRKVAVIGCGPAGLTCAYFLKLMGYDVQAFEASAQLGGLPSKAMATFRLDHKLLYKEIEEILSLGIPVRENSVFGEDFNFETLWRDGFEAVFIASGLQVIPKIELQGSNLPGVIDALSFLSAARRRVKRELSQKVAVLGNNNLTVDTALLASELGARDIYIITETDLDQLSASPGRLAEARSKGIKILTGRKIVRISGEGRVEKLETSVICPEGDRENQPDIYGSLEVETVVVALPRKADHAMKQYLSGHLKMKADGTVLVNRNTMMTSREGVFAGGDLVSGEGLVVMACADGRRAAASIDEFLSTQQVSRI